MINSKDSNHLKHQPCRTQPSTLTLGGQSLDQGENAQSKSFSSPKGIKGLLEHLECAWQEVEEEGAFFKSVNEETKIVDNDYSFERGNDLHEQESKAAIEEDAESIKHVNWFVRKYYPWLALTAGFIYGTQAFIQSFMLNQNAQ